LSDQWAPIVRRNYANGRRNGKRCGLSGGFCRVWARSRWEPLTTHLTPCGSARPGCARDPIDVVVTDTVMPKMSGPELVAKLRATHPSITVIFMSGHTPETVDRHGGADLGTAFFQKPFEVDDLLAKVREMPADGPPRAPQWGNKKGGGFRHHPVVSC
jgi:CheY-like chemotaxis protein